MHAGDTTLSAGTDRALHMHVCSFIPSIHSLGPEQFKFHVQCVRMQCHTQLAIVSEARLSPYLQARRLHNQSLLSCASMQHALAGFQS